MRKAMRNSLLLSAQVARSGSSPLHSTIVSTLIPTRNDLAAPSTGIASWRPKNKRTCFKVGAPFPIRIAAPGIPNCPAKSLDETYGFQYCPGDDALLRFVGKSGYRDPACDFKDAPFDTSTPHGSVDQRQDPCDLRFGTSTGALGLRKFPNPNFDPEKWRKLNGSLASWDAYSKFMAGDDGSGDSRTNRLFDGSIEPPFRIGMSCGACHISYSALKPPADPNNPKWENIDGLVGNQFSRVSQLLASGHVAAPSRVATDCAGATRYRRHIRAANGHRVESRNNEHHRQFCAAPHLRPAHPQMAQSVPCPGGPQATCWCEPQKPGKCWQRSERIEAVQNILKGGEDNIGAAEAIQRVYFNIGSCAEQCWLNHVPDLRAIDPSQRNYGQTPFDIGQCRRDCASFRAIEDRLQNVVDFLPDRRPSDLYVARGLSRPTELNAQLDQEFGQGAVALGRDVFARTCAGCHSSQSPPFDKANFHATDPKDPTLRLDFLSNEQPVFATRVGTYAGRAMHSNHMPSRVWAEYARDHFARAPGRPGACARS